MEYKFIELNSPNYKKAVHLRTSLFFNNFENPDDLINDEYEEESIHVVCIEQENVVGTGRLTIIDHVGIISQMAIQQEFQGMQIGKNILNILTKKCYEKNIEIIKLSARKTALYFYIKYGFKTSGGFYPSEKTGITHQNMTKTLH